MISFYHKIFGDSRFRVKTVVTSELREKRFFRQLFGSNSTERHIHSISLIFFVHPYPGLGSQRSEKQGGGISNLLPATCPRW
jgi:hypothetical protein